MKILYFTALENTYKNDIHTNQVLGLNNKGIDYTFFFLSPLFILNRRGFSINKNKFAKSIADEVKIPILSYHLCMHVIVLPYFLLISLIPFVLKIRKYKPAVVHCRNMISSLLAIVYKKLFKFRYKIVCDPRSVYVEECVITNTFKYKGLNFRIWKKLESFIYQNSDACIGLSEYFKDYLAQYNPNSFFIPAIVSDKSVFSESRRISLRNKFELTDSDVVACYLGSIDLWHSAVNLVKYLKTLQRSLSNNQKFYIVFLSGNANAILYLKRFFDDETFIQCGRVNPSEVLDFLLLSDFGIVPGSNNAGECYDLLYKTMISSKAEEFLVSGLPLYVNPCISSLVDLIIKYEAGFVYGNKNINNNIDRQRISKSFVALFGANSVVKKYKELYTNILA